MIGSEQLMGWDDYISWHIRNMSASHLSNHRQSKLRMRFIRLCMRVELDFINYLKMVHNKEIKMSYLIVIVLIRFWVFLRRFKWFMSFHFLYLPTVQTRKSLETSQTHPDCIRTQRQWGKSSLFLYFRPFSSNLRNQVKLSYKVL